MVKINGNDYRSLCVTTNLKEISYVYLYLLKNNDIPIHALAHEGIYGLLVLNEEYEKTLKKLWTFVSKHEVSGINFAVNKLFNLYFLSQPLFSDMKWYDVNDNIFAMNERVIARCKIGNGPYGKHGKLVFDEFKSYLNDFSVYLAMNDACINCDLYSDMNDSNIFLLVVSNTDQNFCMKLFYDFVLEYGTGPFANIEFLDEIGRVINFNDDKVKKISKNS